MVVALYDAAGRHKGFRQRASYLPFPSFNVPPSYRLTIALLPLSFVASSLSFLLKEKLPEEGEIVRILEKKDWRMEIARQHNINLTGL